VAAGKGGRSGQKTGETGGGGSRCGLRYQNTKTRGHSGNTHPVALLREPRRQLSGRHVARCVRSTEHRGHQCERHSEELHSNDDLVGFRQEAPRSPPARRRQPRRISPRNGRAREQKWRLLGRTRIWLRCARLRHASVQAGPRGMPRMASGRAGGGRRPVRLLQCSGSVRVRPSNCEVAESNGWE
jgi:hypothetical protein